MTNPASEDSQDPYAVLNAYEAELSELKELLEPGMQEQLLAEQAQLLQDQMTELRRQISMVDTQLSKFKTTKLETSRRLRVTEFNIERAKRDVAVAEQARLKLAELELKSKQFDERTRNAPWRKNILRHQLDGAHFLANAERAIIADEMGTGKTFTTIAAAAMLDVKRACVIVPGGTMAGWEREFQRWDPDRKVIVIGKMPWMIQEHILNKLKDDIEQEFTVIINYESWRRNRKLIPALVEMRFQLVITDEAHRIKKGSGITYSGIKDLVFADNSCPVATCSARKDYGQVMCAAGHEDLARGCSVKYYYALTGTPILNRPDEIWPLLHMCQPTMFPYLNDFQYRYCTRDVEGHLLFRFGGQAELARKISGMYIRRTMEQAGIELPPQDIIYHDIEFDEDLYPQQAELLEILRKRAQIIINSEEGKASTPMTMLPYITRQRQAITWPGGIRLREPVLDDWGMPQYDEDGEMVMQIVEVEQKYHESQKLDEAEQIVTELNADGHRCVIFSQFLPVIREMRRRLGDRTVEYHGQVATEERDMIARNFDKYSGEEPKWDNVVANFKTGGEGLTLTQATCIVVIDENWNPGGNDQAYARIRRIGQEQNTQVHILRIEKSIDTWMARLLERKEDMLSGFNSENKRFDLMTEYKAMFDHKVGEDYDTDDK